MWLMEERVDAVSPSSVDGKQQRRSDLHRDVGLLGVRSMGLLGMGLVGGGSRLWPLLLLMVVLW